MYSKETPIRSDSDLQHEVGEENPARRAAPGSIAFVPSVAGLIAAGEVIRDLSER